MRKARIRIHSIEAGILTQEAKEGYVFKYHDDYKGPPISLAMPVRPEPYEYDEFPPFFDGLLPEGVMLEGLLKMRKLDKSDYMGQLIATGADLVGAVTVLELAHEDE
jgi:serine/threonine-protein kinase HipA